MKSMRMRLLMSLSHSQVTDFLEGHYLDGTTYRRTVDVRSARVAMSRYLLPIEREQAGIINAFGRTLAEDLATDTPIPPCHTAAIAGYAVIASDTLGATRQAPKSLSVLSASAPHGKELEPHTTMRVAAGDPLPEGADSVIDLSETYRPDHGPEVIVFAEVMPGNGVIQTGSITPSGAIMLRHVS